MKPKENTDLGSGKMLTETQRKLRDGKLTGSKVGVLMTGDKAKIVALWRELCGDPTFVEESLDDVWAVQLGSCTEALNLDWYTKIKGKQVTRRGEVVQHPDYPWAAATLDGYDAALPGPIEAKHTNGFTKHDEILQRYMPQFHWAMECTKTKFCVASIIEGARQPSVDIIEYDEAYAKELMSRALKFMEHVWALTEPVIMDAVTAPQISRLRDYDMSTNNVWVNAAASWLEHRLGKKAFDEAEKQLKGTVPDDARTCAGGGVVVQRDRALRLSVRMVEDNGRSPQSKR
jgi:predicted phage-related endonuclease